LDNIIFLPNHNEFLTLSQFLKYSFDLNAETPLLFDYLSIKKYKLTSHSNTKSIDFS